VGFVASITGQGCVRGRRESLGGGHWESYGKRDSNANGSEHEGTFNRGTRSGVLNRTIKVRKKRGGNTVVQRSGTQSSDILKEGEIPVRSPKSIRAIRGKGEVEAGTPAAGFVGQGTNHKKGTTRRVVCNQ